MTAGGKREETHQKKLSLWYNEFREASLTLGLEGSLYSELASKRQGILLIEIFKHGKMLTIFLIILVFKSQNPTTITQSQLKFSNEHLLPISS